MLRPERARRKVHDLPEPTPAPPFDGRRAASSGQMDLNKKWMTTPADYKLEIQNTSGLMELECCVRKLVRHKSSNVKLLRLLQILVRGGLERVSVGGSGPGFRARFSTSASTSEATCGPASAAALQRTQVQPRRFSTSGVRCDASHPCPG